MIAWQLRNANAVCIHESMTDGSPRLIARDMTTCSSGRGYPSALKLLNWEFRNSTWDVFPLSVLLIAGPVQIRSGACALVAGKPVPALDMVDRVPACGPSEIMHIAAMTAC